MATRAASIAAEQPLVQARPPDTSDGARPPADHSPGGSRHAHSGVDRDRQRFERLFAQNPAATALIDRAGRVTAVNAAMTRLLGREPEALVDAPLAALAQGDGRTAVTEMLFVLLGGERSARPVVVRLAGAGGREVVARLVPVALCEGGSPPQDAMVVVEDLTHRVRAREERRQLMAALDDRATADDLTGMRNRRGMEERLRQAVAAIQPGAMAGVLVVDVDRFKMINDSLGHATGDELLRIVAERMLEACSGATTIGRFGSDEFLVVVEQASSVEELAALARSLLAAVMEPVTVGGYRVTPSVSIGIGATSDPGCRPEALLCDADVSIQRVKQEGGGDFELPPAGSRQNMTARLRDESDLRHAIAKGELVVHYQPVLGRNGAILGVEALVRWPHPVRGMLLPGEFIPLAEETGLVVPLGNWVLRQATAQVARWRKTVAPNLHLGVNVSAKQLMRVGWSQTVVEALAQSGLEPEALCLEITETALVRDLSTLTDAFEELRTAGVRLAIDDFGTGYSSLEALHRLPIDSLKIDRSFIAAAGQDSRAAELARTIVQMARNLGLGVIAEGVETAAQFEFLLALDCTMGQGYYFSAPMPGPEVGDFLVGADVKGAVSLS